MKSGIRDVFQTFGARVVTIVFGIGIQSCLAWFLQPSGRGSYAVCLVFASVIAVVCTFGIDVAGNYCIASRRFSLSEGIMSTLLLAGLGSAIGVAAGLIAVDSSLAFFSKASRTSFELAIVYIPLQIAALCTQQFLVAVMEFGFLSLMIVFQGAFQLVLVILLVAILRWDAEGALLSSVLSSAFINIATLIYLWHKYEIHFVKPKYEHIRAMIGYGARYYIASISNMLNVQLGQIFLGSSATRADVGLFSVGNDLTTRVTLLPDVMGNVIQPRIAGDPRGRPELTAKCARFTGLVCALIILGICVFSKPMVRKLFSPEFLPVVPIVWILSLGIVVRCCTKVLIPYLNGTNRPGVFSVATAVSVLVNLVSLVVLLPRIGVNGAAWAMTFGYWANGLILCAAFLRFSGMSVLEAFGPRYSDIEVWADLWNRARRRLGTR